MGYTVVEKIAEAHRHDAGSRRRARCGDYVSIRPSHVMTHDNTSAVIEKFRALGASRVRDPAQPVLILDHDIQNRTAANLSKYRVIERFAREQGLAFHPAGSGIGHQVLVEQLYVRPGGFVVAADSHANMYGGVGALGTPVVRSDAAAIWATGAFWWQIPRTVRVILDGELPTESTGKDLILALCGRYRNGEVLNAVVEFDGPGVATLSLEERLAVANMTTEWGAVAGWFPVDRTTLAYLEERHEILARRGVHRAALAANLPGPDADADYAGTITVDLQRVAPHVAGPDSVQLSTPLAELEARRIPVHKAYLVSCVNSRLEDLAAAAAVLDGRRVAEGVELYVAAASREVQEEAERLGHWPALLEAGARPLPSGCGPCIGLGAGLLEAGETGISATNRNFRGRMGSVDAHCYLASPAVVAASAAAGYICGTVGARQAGLPWTFEDRSRPTVIEAPLPVLPGFPSHLSGRLIFLPQDDLDTDGIYGKEYTYRDDVTPEAMAEVVLEHHDPTFRTLSRAGDILVGGRNFGCGSSREQAVTALQSRGVALVIAESIFRTYLRNAFNNGLIAIEAVEFVQQLRRELEPRVRAGEKTIVSADILEVDFSRGQLRFRSLHFSFPPLGLVPQALIVAGGIVPLVRAELNAGQG